jgi:ribosomal-protein-alanine N-acetyltransferase
VDARQLLGLAALGLPGNCSAGDEIIGYFVAIRESTGASANITVEPEHQGQGSGRVMLDALALWARARPVALAGGAHQQQAGQHITPYGYRRVGGAGRAAGENGREDAIVMSYKL